MASIASKHDPAVGGVNLADYSATDVPVGSSSRALYIGSGGDLVVVMADGTTAIFTAVPQGSLLPVQATAITSGTTAAKIVALY